MSPLPLSPQSTGSTHPYSAGSPTVISRTGPENTMDPTELERRLRVLRELTPSPEECIERWRADVQRDYDQIIALGGRPTRPIQQYSKLNTTIVDRSTHYREDYERVDVINEMGMSSEEDDRESSHWAKERNKWGAELSRWKNFREAQRIHNQGGRSELDLELENTGVALIEALNKLNDWQQFQFIHQKRVFDAERYHDQCQQGIAKSHGVMVATSSADRMLKMQEPSGGWMTKMMRARELLEASQKELTWVKDQWTEVIAEAYASIATAPKLQLELESKVETQTRALYRILLLDGARPSCAVQSPDENAELPQRLQHWISESSGFTAEMWQWKMFKAWRRAVKKADVSIEAEQKQPSPMDSCLDMFEDLVKYSEHELEKALSWVICWRRQVEQYAKGEGSTSLQKLPSYSTFPYIDDYDEYADNDVDDEDEMTEAKWAEVYAMQAEAEEKVAFATKRLEQSKQKLRGVLAEFGPSSTGPIAPEDPGLQSPITPPNSQSPESLPKIRRLSEETVPPEKATDDQRRRM